MARIVITLAAIVFCVLDVGSVAADVSRLSTTLDGDNERIGVAVADTSDEQEASGSQRGGSGGRVQRNDSH
jgi:hypothetical protein